MRHKSSLLVLELFELDGGDSFLAVVLVVADEEATGDLPELAVALHVISGKI